MCRGLTVFRISHCPVPLVSEQQGVSLMPGFTHRCGGGFIVFDLFILLFCLLWQGTWKKESKWEKTYFVWCLGEFHWLAPPMCCGRTACWQKHPGDIWLLGRQRREKGYRKRLEQNRYPAQDTLPGTHFLPTRPPPPNCHHGSIIRSYDWSRN